MSSTFQHGTANRIPTSHRAASAIIERGMAEYDPNDTMSEAALEGALELTIDNYQEYRRVLEAIRANPVANNGRGKAYRMLLREAITRMDDPLREFTNAPAPKDEQLDPVADLRYSPC